MTLLLSLLLVFAGALAAPWMVRAGRGWLRNLLLVVPLGAFLLLLGGLPAVAAGGAVSLQLPWFPSLGVTLDLRMDGLSAVMGLLVTGIGALIVLYSFGYLGKHPQYGRFASFLLAFMGAMLGLVLADNLILLFIFWELTSITSYLLIGFLHEDPQSRKKALQALLVTGLGAVVMLAGFILLGEVAGTYRISELLGEGALLTASPLYPAILLLILAGAFTKSGQVPFHFWLPNAMVAPTPVSAYLHSATMVKAGVFLLARLHPALGGTEMWTGYLVVFGGLTLLTAVVLGLFQTDLKGILAYTTLGVLGLLTMLLGVGTELALKSMIVFLIGHALYKAALFMTAGAVDHETGTRELTHLRGLRFAMPLTATAALLAALSKSGFPPFFGFIGKEAVYEAAGNLGGLGWGVLAVAVGGNMLMMALALKAGIAPFWGRPSGQTPKPPHEGPFSLWFGPLLLGSIGLLLGLVPGLIGPTLVAPAVSAMTGAPSEVYVKLWHGFNLPLLLSLLTLAGGLVLFRLRHHFWRVAPRVRYFLRARGAEATYDLLFASTVALAEWQTRTLQSGRLYSYVRIVLLFTVVLVGGAILSTSLRLAPPPLPGPIEALPAGIVLTMIVGAVLAAVTDNRITALLGLGTVGFGMALLFTYYGAPDLAITQLLVETLTVVLFMFVIYRLPHLRHPSRVLIRLRDAGLAALFGLCMSYLALEAITLNLDTPISERLAAMSYPLAKGKNVVNVILVDFRALDTLGEITVLVAAALGVAALVTGGLRRRRRKRAE